MITCIAIVGGALGAYLISGTHVFAAGELIKVKSNSAVYYIYNGKRYAFPNEKVFFSWYVDFSHVKTISEAELAAITLGGNVTYRPGYKLVKINTDPKVYAVASKGVLRWVTTEALAKSYYGNGWAKKVDDINDAFFINYKIGTPIEDTTTYSPSGEFAANPFFVPPGEDAPIVVTPNGYPDPSKKNLYSWDGNWNPTAASFPLTGLFDNEYFDGHAMSNGSVSPILPPGIWDWNDQNNDLANWKNFSSSVGTFEALKDSNGQQYGWRLIGKTPGAVDYSGLYFQGSSGADILNLGAKGDVSSFGGIKSDGRIEGSLGDGPDVLVFDTGHTFDIRTGSSLEGSKNGNDNDLVIAGCAARPDGSFGIRSASIHTGPGSDLVFVKNMRQAGVDAGDGDGGKSGVLDPKDGNDVVIFRGNMADFRFTGGAGDDVAVWYPDDVKQTDQWLGPSFFGGSSAGSGLWDGGSDRLVLALPVNTPIIDKTPTPNGSLMIKFITESDDYVLDGPTKQNPYAQYCITCGVGPGGKKGLVFEYNSANGKVHSGYFWVTDMEELQIGVGADAKVYKLDNVNAKANLDASLKPFIPPQEPALCQG